MDDVITNSTDVFDQISTMTELLSKYGIATVLIAVFLVLFIVVIVVLLRNTKVQVESSNANMLSQIENYKKQIEDQSTHMTDSNTKFINSIMDQNTALVKTMQDTLAMITASKQEVPNQAITKVDTTKIVDSYIDISISLKSICKSILCKLDCARVAIYVFHNGNSSIRGLPFFKISCIGEWLKRSSQYSGAKLQTDIPLYIFADMIETLYNKGEFLQEKIEPNSPYLEFVGQGNNSFAIFQISDDEEEMPGFIMIEFREAQDFSNNSAIISEIRSIIADNNPMIGDIITDSDIESRIKS